MKSYTRNKTKATYSLLTGMLLLGFVCAADCQGKSEKSDRAEDTAMQATFATAEEACQALQAAARANDEAALAHILGSESKAILSSGDTVEDKAAIASFVTKYERMHRWATMTDGSRILYVGADNYPNSIPLTQNSSLEWYFNTATGEDEILARRIGKNELLAIDVISAMANAEELYFKSSHEGNPARQYTQKILSTAGKQDGLYWEVPKDQPSSPLGRLSDFAKDVVASNKPVRLPYSMDTRSAFSLPRETRPKMESGATLQRER